MNKSIRTEKTFIPHIFVGELVPFFRFFLAKATGDGENNEWNFFLKVYSFL